MDGRVNRRSLSVVCAPSPNSTGHLSADVLCQLDNDPLGAADVAEPVAVLVALQLADELSAAGSQAGDDGVDVFDGERYMADARRVRRRVPIAALCRRRVEFRQLESSVAIRGLQERDLCPDAVEPHDAVHPAALDPPASVQLESKFDEELGRGREVVNHDPDVIHPLDRHALYGNESRPTISQPRSAERPGAGVPDRLDGHIALVFGIQR
jgi:hypothetical protein